MSASASTSGSSTGSTPTLEERLKPLDVILENSNDRFDLIDAQVLSIQKDLNVKYYKESETGGPLDLTLGIEIEGVLLQDTKVFSRWIDNKATGVSAVQQAVHYALSEPVTMHCPMCDQPHTYQLPLNPLCAEGREIDTGLGYDKWTVGLDTTVHAESMRLAFHDRISSIDDLKQFRFHGFELRSRVMGDGKRLLSNTISSCPHQPQIAYQEEIRAVYDLLRDAFLNPHAEPERRAWRLMVNDSCGLHVHIGNGSNRLPLQTVKNVFSLYTANERQIDSMHSRDRITGSTLIRDPSLNGQAPNNGALYHLQDRALTNNSKQVYNRPLSAHFAFMAHANRTHIDDYKLRQQNGRLTPYPNRRFKSDPALEADAYSTNASAWLRIIHKAPAVDYLRDIQARSYHAATVNLENMAPTELRSGSTAVRVVKAKNTIEFRQAAGTLDSNAALAWVDVLVKLVEYSHATPCAQVLAECQAVWQDIDHTTLDLLSSLGYDRKHPTFVHYKHVGPWVSPAMTYGRTRLSSELALADTFGDNMAEFMVFNSKKLCEELDVEAVSARIEEKFINLCYGQFTKKYIVNLANEQDWPAVKSEHQERLTIGWTCPLPSSSRSGDDGGSGGGEEDDGGSYDESSSDSNVDDGDSDHGDWDDGDSDDANPAAADTYWNDNSDSSEDETLYSLNDSDDEMPARNAEEAGDETEFILFDDADEDRSGHVSSPPLRPSASN